MAPKELPQGLNLQRFFGDHFYDFERLGGDRARQVLALVRERRSRSQCDICGLPTGISAESPKEFIGAYICDHCRRGLQSRH